MWRRQGWVGDKMWRGIFRPGCIFSVIGSGGDFKSVKFFPASKILLAKPPRSSDARSETMPARRFERFENRLPRLFMVRKLVALRGK